MNKKHGITFEAYLKNFKLHVSKLGFKNSIQKDYILKILFYSEDHLSAEQIAFNVKKDYNIDVGIATVYRTVKFFEDLKIIDSLDVGDSIKRYELKVDEHHDHLVCTSCHKIIEFSDDFIENKQELIAKSNGFILKDHSMIIYGLCEDCQ